MSVRRFDFVGSTRALETTPQGFVRVDARLTRTGIFTYTQDGKTTRELRCPEEVFHADSLKSIAGAPVTDLHPENFVSPENAKELSVGFAGAQAWISAMPKATIGKTLGDLEWKIRVASLEGFVG